MSVKREITSPHLIQKKADCPSSRTFKPHSYCHTSLARQSWISDMCKRVKGNASDYGFETAELKWHFVKKDKYFPFQVLGCGFQRVFQTISKKALKDNWKSKPTVNTSCLVRHCLQLVLEKKLEKHWEKKIQITKDYEEFDFGCLIYILCWILLQVFTTILSIL